MDNYEAIAYACVALRQLKSENKVIDEENLKGEMISLMDMHSESEIFALYEEEK